jgi:hypothetical protein
MRRIAPVAVAVLTLSCGNDETPPCEDGFVKKNGRWCVYTEAPLIVTADGASGAGDGDPTSPGTDPDAPDQPSDPSTAPDPVDPSNYIHETEAVEPALTLAEIEQGIMDAILTVQTLDPAPLHESYRDAQAYGAPTPTELGTIDTGGDPGAEDCPNYDWDYYWENHRDYWRDACTVAAGASFSGYAYSYDFGSYTDASETYNYGGYAYYNGSAKVVDGVGYTFTGSGTSSYYEREHTTSLDTTFYSSLSGNFRSDKPAYADTWLAKDLNIALYLYATRYAADGSLFIQVSASVSGLEGTINAIRFEDTILYSESLGSMCELEPSGKISLRGPEGHWYEAEFHGPKYWGAGAFPPDCDSCGPVYFRGQLLGEVCPDFSALRDWEVRPWH